MSLRRWASNVLGSVVPVADVLANVDQRLAREGIEDDGRLLVRSAGLQAHVAEERHVFAEGVQLGCHGEGAHVDEMCVAAVEEDDVAGEEVHAYEALLPAVVVVVDADVLVDPAWELEDVDEFVADLAVVVVVREVEAHGSFVSA